MKRLSILGVSWAILATAGSAGAYELLGAKWSRSALPVPYKVDLNSSRDLGRSATRTVVEASFATWAAPSCSAFRASFSSEVTGGRADANDGQNTLVWIYGSWPAELGGSDTIGVTTPVWYQGGSMVDADMQFNGASHRWTTSPSGYNDVDAQSIITHEAGHFLGLDHSNVVSATMYYAYEGGTSLRTLASDDISGVCALYPSGPGSECSSSRPCPNNQQCQNGYCIAGSGGGGTLGSSCTEGCATGFYCVCTDEAQTNCFCTRDCDSSNPCPTSWQCAPLQSGGGACVPQGTLGNGQLGDPCGGGQDCSNGFCVGISASQGVCSQTCTDSQPCPSGYYCAPLQGGGGACLRSAAPSDGGSSSVPDAGAPLPPQPLGASCSGSLQCQSRWCAYLADSSQRICTQSCDENNPCPGGFHCGALVGGTLGCLTGDEPGPGPEGPVEGEDGGLVQRPPSGGCGATPGEARGSMLWLLLLAGAVFAVRRRRA
jgi:MYXO-CTERM domain-containing protein